MIDIVSQEIICNHIVKPDDSSKVLDFNCQEGDFITILQLEPDQYIGVDFSQNINTSKKIYPDYKFLDSWIGKSFIKADIICASFYDGCFFDFQYLPNILFDNLEYQGVFFIIVNTHIGEDRLFDIQNKIREKNMSCDLWGLEYSMPKSEYKNFEQRFLVQNTMTLSGELDGCRYWIMSGKRKDTNVISLQKVKKEGV